MAREGLREALTGVIRKALKDPRPITLNGLRVGTNGGTQMLDVVVQAIEKPEALRGRVLVVFKDVAEPPARRRAHKSVASEAHAALQQELLQTREALQVTHEEMQTTVEELKSSNEELQSTNEELQSTNEELTTSKEELQSLNEELQTVNAELQSKVDDLTWVRNDMANLLNSTEVATVFLDNQMKLRRFTTHATRLFKLIPGDVGRPLSHVVTDLDYPRLRADAEEVLRTLVFVEKTVATHDARWYRVRIMPYRTQENVIDGVVITFIDITAARALEQRLREQAGHLWQLAESLPTLVWGCRADGACDYLNRQWLDYTGIPEAEQLGFRWLEQIHPEDREYVRDEWRASVKSGVRLDVSFRIRRADGAYRWFKTRATPIRDAQGAVVKWYGTSTDVDDMKQADDERTVLRNRLAMVVGQRWRGESFCSMAN
jgi:PAS domain S-box-containing protein